MGFLQVDDSQVQALTADVRRGVSRVRTRVGLAVRKTAHDIEADAKQLAPVDTGNLRNSISSTVRGTELSTTAIVGPTAEYGIYQELGTSRMAAQPFMAPAFDRRLPGFADAIGQAGEDML